MTLVGGLTDLKGVVNYAAVSNALDQFSLRLKM
jgi:hypothetical protein